MSRDRFAQFRDLVLRDPELLAQLRAILDRTVFIERLLELGAERGYLFSAEEIESALAAARREWNQHRSVR